MGANTRPTKGRKGTGKTCVVAIPEQAREAYEDINAKRRAAGKSKMPMAVVLEAMISEGIKGNWKPTAEKIQQRKAATQKGRGRPRKE